MISVQVMANCIHELRAITKTDLAVFGTDGAVVTSTFDASIISEELIRGFSNSPADWKRSFAENS